MKTTKNNILDKPEYDFLKFSSELGKNIQLLTYGGSKAYGTDLPSSDTDIRGVATNTPESILSYKDFEIYTDTETDTSIYSLDKFFKLMSECNPNILEIVSVRPQDILYATDIGNLIVQNKSIFLSTRCANTFGGYATQQLYRLRQKTLSALSPKEYNEHISKVIANMQEHLRNRWNTTAIRIEASETGLHAVLKEDVLPAENLYGIINEINNVIREYNKESKRNKNALDRGKIQKHAMHLIRLYQQGTELLLNGNFCTYREKDHDLLMAIRNGEFTKDNKMTEEFFRLVQSEEAKFVEAKNKTKLPAQPDYEKINKLQQKINKMIIMKAGI